MALRSDRLDAIVSLSKRRGFVYPSSEIYGGLRASWDYGPLGVELKNNIKRQWWRSMVTERDDIVGLDSSVILAREVWEASGHVTEFVDPLTECTFCHKRYRADHLIEAYEERHGHAPVGGLEELSCPNCGNRGTFSEPRMFNGLLRTHLGPVEDESGLAYLRPETAQGIFINFKNVLQTSRKKIPFGIGQGSPIYYDMEGYDRTNSGRRPGRNALRVVRGVAVVRPVQAVPGQQDGQDWRDLAPDRRRHGGQRGGARVTGRSPSRTG